MPLVYGLVARGSTVLSEYFASTGNAPYIARRILTKIPPQEQRKSYGYEGSFFHYHADGSGLVVLVMGDDPDATGTRIAFSCIADIRSKFQGLCGDLWRTSSEGGLNDIFSRTLHEQLEFYSYSDEADKIRQAKQSINSVKDVMKDNIEKVIDRGDKIENLKERTEVLEDAATEFKHTSVKLKRQMWWKNKKICCACWTVAAIIIAIIVLILIFKVF
mmetsp:Transcript_16888/g.25233  ORF Transcript_16888/g.25233 Transcript_16888/m.25233 type:complete len:217 (+) Transcript_16888:29-679(+)